MGPNTDGYLLITAAVVAIVQKSDAFICPNLDSVPPGYTSKTFISTSKLLVNPGRGFYIHTETKTSNYQELTSSYIAGLVNNSGGPATVSMVFRHIVLDNFISGNLTSMVVNHIRNDLEAVKTTGVLALLKFSYTVTFNNSLPYGDADKATILSHIEILGPVFQDYQCVIAAVQAGFIGVWGDWHYSDHFGVPGTLSAQNVQDRNEVLNALIAALPFVTTTQIRRPVFKYTVFGLTPTTYIDVQNRTAKSRVGHYNDCFLASLSDFGTYQNTTVEYPYLMEDTKYTVMAGETCSLSSESRHQCITALNELQMFHWTSMNILYNNLVIQFWKNYGCFSAINRQLGYRLKLKSIVLPDITNGTICVNMTLVNEGFAAPVREYDLRLVLKSSSGQLYASPPLCDIDSRTWLPGVDHFISGSVPVPYGIPDGLYKAYLELSDKLMPGNKNYNILLASRGVPNSALRLNYLMHSIQKSLESVTRVSLPKSNFLFNFLTTCLMQITSTSTGNYTGCASGCITVNLPDKSFENNQSSWYNFVDGFLMVSGNAKHGNFYIEITNGGAYQDIMFPVGTRSFLMKVWSRHTGTISVANPADYSIYCDVKLTDATYDYGRTANFDPNSSPNIWQNVTLQVTETKDIESARCYAMFRNGVGVAHFDLFEVWSC